MKNKYLYESTKRQTTMGMVVYSRMQGHRTWSTVLREELLIHAGWKFDNTGYKQLRSTTAIKIPEIEEFDRGGIIGSIKIVDCVTENDSPWFNGPYGFVLSNPKTLPFLACRGQKGFLNTITKFKHLR